MALSSPKPRSSYLPRSVQHDIVRQASFESIDAGPKTFFSIQGFKRSFKSKGQVICKTVYIDRRCFRIGTFNLHMTVPASAATLQKPAVEQVAQKPELFSANGTKQHEAMMASANSLSRREIHKLSQHILLSLLCSAAHGRRHLLPTLNRHKARKAKVFPSRVFGKVRSNPSGMESDLTAG